MARTNPLFTITRIDAGLLGKILEADGTKAPEGYRHD
jgi:hypothetical protein